LICQAIGAQNGSLGCRFLLWLFHRSIARQPQAKQAVPRQRAAVFMGSFLLRAPKSLFKPGQYHHLHGHAGGSARKGINDEPLAKVRNSNFGAATGALWGAIFVAGGATFVA